MRSLSLLAAAAAIADAAPSPFACNFLINASSYGSSSCGLLPFPDDFFLSTTWNSSAPPSLTFTNDTFPRDNSGNPIKPVYGGWNSLQGFSPLPQITAYFPDLSLSYSGLPRLWNQSSSLNNPTLVPSLLLDAETMQPVQHWTELDFSSGDASAGPQALLIWPAHSLNYGRKYIVALRNLRDNTGALIPRSEGFSAIVDGTPTDNPAIEASRPRFKEILTALSTYAPDGSWLPSSGGGNAGGLTLAWSFTVNNKQDVTGRFVTMRDDAFRRTNNGKNIAYSITKVTDNPDGLTAPCARQIQGYFWVPRYINQNGPGANVRLVLDPVTNQPVYQGVMPVNFTVRIPKSLTGTGTTPTPPQTGRLLAYGHGLFGHCACNDPLGNCASGELEAGYLNHESHQMNATLFCTNEIGMAEEDALVAGIVIGADLSDFAFMPDRLHQGILNELLLAKFMMNSAFAHDPSVTFFNSQTGKNVSVLVTANNTVVGDRPIYYGNSNGGIYGSLYLAVSTDVVRGTSGVAGAPYSQLLPRSHDFDVLFDLIKTRYKNPADRISLLAIIGERWSRLEPSAYARTISVEPLPNTPTHTILLQSGLGDAQVSIFGVQTLARSVGSLAPNSGGKIQTWETNPVEGNETLSDLGFSLIADDAVLSGVGYNAISTFGFVGVPVVPFINNPANASTDTHGLTRLAPQVQAQHQRFLLTGEIANPCPGMPQGCNPLPIPSSENDND